MSNRSVESQNKHKKTAPLQSFDGRNFYTSRAVWKLNKDVTLDFTEIKGLMVEEVFKGYVATIAYFAVNQSAHYTMNLHSYYVRLYRFAKGKAIDVALLIEYRGYLGVDRAYFLLFVRLVMCKWRALGYLGLNDAVVDMLVGWRIKGNVKGDAIKRLDLECGPLSDIELQGLLEKAILAYELGLLNIVEISLLMLTSASARRPIQLTALRLKDLEVRPTIDGAKGYFVNVPRAKQQGVAFRGAFREIGITEEVWAVLMVQKEHVKNSFERYLGCTLLEDCIRELPLFFNPQSLARTTKLEEFDQLNSGDFYHMVSGEVTQVLKRAVKVANVYSERTGTLLNITATRLRYTLGTRAAREGYGVLVIAELLDHNDTQNAHVYTLNVPEHAARIDAAVGHQLAPYARAFAGVLVDDKQQARRGNTPGSDIRDFSGKGTGTCGHGGTCGANVPVPCYTCPHFQPWLEGPHDLIYVHLIEERDEVTRVTGDAAIAAVLDRTILAVAEVIQACASRKEELRGTDEASSHG